MYNSVSNSKKTFKTSLRRKEIQEFEVREKGDWMCYTYKLINSKKNQRR